MDRSVGSAVGALVVASALWGCAVPASKFGVGGVGPVTLLAIELLAATAFLWVVVWMRGWRPGVNWRLAAVLGLLEPCVAYAGETLGLTRTAAANASVITGLETTFVVLLGAVFLQERLTAEVGAAVVAGLAGLVVLEGVAGLRGPGTGDLLVLAGTLSAAGYTIVARGGDPGADPLGLTAVQFSVAAAAAAPVAAMTWATGAEAAPTHLAGRFWLVAVATGIAGFATSFLLYNWAVARVRAQSAAVLINLIPAFGLASSVLALRERLTVNALAGAALITASVAFFTVQEFRQQPARPAMPTEEPWPSR